ncbi:MAG TPA: ABC transporter ATP-binding protein [Nodosilinea sp.]|nr:ABC transporter ATP-binding protein [Nodosilinea sp.]
MFNFSREWQAVATLRPLLRLAPGAMPLVIGFGVVTALSEGLSLSLFMPLFQSLTEAAGPPDTTALGRLWSLLLARFSPAEVQLVAPLGILALLAVKNGLLYLNTVIFSRFNWRISHRLRSQIFSQLLRVNSEFLMEYDAGRLMSILDKEAWQATQALSTLAVLVISLCTLAVFSVFLLLTSWPLTVVSLLLLATVSGGIQTLTRRVKELGQQAAQANLGFVGKGFEQLSGLETIRQFGRQDDEQRQFERASLQVCTTFMELDRLMGAIAPLSELAFAALLTGVLVMVVRSDAANLSVFLTFLFMLYRLSPQVRALDGARVNLVALAASVQVITELLEATRQNQMPNGHRPFVALRQGIRFQDVTFRYRQGNAPVLKNLCLEILPGQTTAFVGPSGAGKSTLMGLILRRFDPVSGTVEVDGQPLPGYDLDTWRRSAAVVSQNIYLFNTTVRENIAYGQPGASAAAIVEAAKMAAAHEFITRLPQGYDTVIGERGVRLSGGQRQRLALARCLVRDPQILVLDEATNALDSLSESFIQATLTRLGRDRTVLMIAHRLSTIERADQVFVIDGGRLVERGTVPELLQSSGLFAQLYRLQNPTRGQQ